MRTLIMTVILGLLLLLPAGVNAETESPAKIWQEYATALEEAVKSGNEAAAMDLMCDPVYPPFNTKEFDPAQMVTAMDLSNLITKMLVRRYHEVFEAPANGPKMSPWGNGCVMHMGSFGAYGSSGVCEYSDHPNDVERYNRHKTEPDSTIFAVIINMIEGPILTVDYNLDRQPDLIYAGDRPEIFTDEMTVIVDEAPDGERVQYLMASKGTDPRQQVAIWFYKDGPLFTILVDCDGDGKGDLGRGWWSK